MNTWGLLLALRNKKTKRNKKIIRWNYSTRISSLFPKVLQNFNLSHSYIPPSSVKTDFIPFILLFFEIVFFRKETSMLVDRDRWMGPLSLMLLLLLLLVDVCENKQRTCSDKENNGSIYVFKNKTKICKGMHKNMIFSKILFGGTF